jgi:two-component system sensor kinase FixL
VRGQKLLPYLAAVDKALTDERDVMLRETDSLAKNIEHIKVVVSQQLAAARGETHAVDIVEQVNVCELFDDALGVLTGSQTPPAHLTFVYDSEPLVIGTDRHKVFQIVTNLLANARDAITARGGPGIITLRARPLPEEQVSIEIEDTGVGIAEDTLARIFSHGFTTKKDGHGFGLHSSACAATELGGSLTARSAGLGAGATFTLVLKSVRPPKRTGDRRTSSTHPAEPNP